MCWLASLPLLRISYLVLRESLTAAFSEVAISYVLFILGFALFLALCYPGILMSHL